VKMVWTVSRVLLGLLFAVMGLNGFLLFMPPPPASAMPANVVAFNGAMFASHYMYMTSGAQLLAGVLLLANRYVPFALVVLAGILVNILTFHVTMWPQTIFPLPIIALILWFLTAWPLRPYFAPLFTARIARIEDPLEVQLPRADPSRSQ
jgi:putative oxidoreductase